MKVEINRQTYRTMEYFYNPDWWDKWVRKNLKKKAKLFSKRVK